MDNTQPSADHADQSMNMKDDLIPIMDYLLGAYIVVLLCEYNQ